MNDDLLPTLVANSLMDRIEHLEEQLRFVKRVGIMTIIVIIVSLSLGMYLGAKAVEITPGPPGTLRQLEPQFTPPASLQAMWN